MKASEWFSQLYESYKNDPAFVAEELTLGVMGDLSQAITEQGLTRRELAQKMGLSPAHVSQVLNGKPNVTLLTLAKFAVALDLKVSVRLQPAKAVAEIEDYVTQPAAGLKPERKTYALTLAA